MFYKSEQSIQYQLYRTLQHSVLYGKFKDKYEEELAKVLNPAGSAPSTSWLSPEEIAKQYHSSYETTEFKLPSVDPFMENEQERKTVAMQLLKIHIDRTKHCLQEKPNVIFLGKSQLPRNFMQML